MVLLVEDEEVLRSPGAKLLRKKGFTVLEASGGNTAIETCRTHAAAIDGVLLDVTLPGMADTAVLAELCRIRPQVKVRELAAGFF